MKTTLDVIQEIRGSVSSFGSETFSVDVMDDKVTTVIEGRIIREYKETIGTTHLGFNEPLSELVDESIEVYEINSYNVYGVEIPPRYSKHEIEKHF